LPYWGAGEVSASVKAQKHLFILIKYFWWRKPNSTAMGHSTSLTTNSNISAKHLTQLGRPISAGALKVQADIFHSFSQLSQEDVTLIIAFLCNPLITISYCPHISNGHT
jgi:hypothetical protein